MNACLFAFCAGVIILYSTATLLPWWLYINALIAFFFCIPKRLLLPSLFFLLGSAYVNEIATKHQSNIVPASLEGVWLNASGVRCSLVSSNERSQSFRFCASEIESEVSEALSGRRILQVSAPLSLQLPPVTESFVLRLKLKRPRGAVNPIGVPLEQYFFQQNIVATGRVADIYQVNAPEVSWPFGWQSQILKWREAILAQLQKAAGQFETHGVMAALVVGDRSGISDGWKKVLVATGTQHLMAISGLHVGMIALLLWRFLPQGRAGLTIFAGVTLLYVVLVGFSASAQRAWLMSLVLALAGAGYLKLNWLTAWLCALTLVLLLDPLSILNMGFIYSFVSVALLVLLAQAGWLSIEAPVRSFLIVQIFFLIMLGMINTILGGEHNGVFVLANLVAVPWVSWFVLPAVLLAFVVSLFDIQLATEFFSWINEVLKFLYVFLDALSASPYAFNQASSSVRLIAYSVILATVIVVGRLTLLSAVCMLLLFLSLVLRSDSIVSEPELLVFDTGQGLSILFRSEGSVWMYDLGPSHGASSSVRRSILPYLRSVSATESMDGLVISHGDNDHAGDYDYFLNRAAPVLRWSGETERLKKHTPARQFSSCREGMHWRKGELAIEVIYPAEASESLSANNHSCVLRVTLGGKIFLLMGDVESTAELGLVKDKRDELKADVLIAGHHGSKNATSFALLKHVLPKVVVFSAGYRNRFGHPHADVVARAKRFDAEVLNTADTGALRFVVRDGKLVTERFRALRAAFWLTP